MSPLLYQLSYPARSFNVSPDGFEPSTPSLKGTCSTRLSYGLAKLNGVDFRFFVLQGFIHLRDKTVRGLLNFFLGPV
jgi:hypothetical protein